jgi:hypothetical protein
MLSTAFSLYCIIELRKEPLSSGSNFGFVLFNELYKNITHQPSFLPELLTGTAYLNRLPRPSQSVSLESLYGWQSVTFPPNKFSGRPHRKHCLFSHILVTDCFSIVEVSTKCLLLTDLYNNKTHTIIVAVEW